MTDRNNPYDIVFSLGFSCGCSQSLRAAGLQFASYPLDWLGIPDLSTAAKIVGQGFSGWMEPEDFGLVDVNHGVGFCTRIYLNEKTQLGYSHEFSDMQRFDAVFPKVKETYDRRVERFMSEAGSAKRILAVYLEHTTRGKADDGTIKDAASVLRKRFPNAEVDVLYFYEKPECRAPVVESDSDGIFVVAADYRTVEEGRVTQFVQIPVVAGFLAANVSAKDLRSPEEKAKYADVSRKMDAVRWGLHSSAFRRWLNHHAYKTYRTLERILRKKGLVQKELPVWFWGKNGQ